MKGLFRILASRPVFAINPTVGLQLRDAAALVLNRQTPFSIESFGVVASDSYVKKVAVQSEGKQTIRDVAVFPIYGTMIAEDEVCGPEGTITKSRQILQAAYDDNISGIVLDIMSPGGQVLGTEELANAIMLARQEKPVIAYVNGEAASAAYRIAVEADHIMLNGKAAEVGSIGVMLHYLDLTERLKKEGVREIKVVSNFSPEKNSFNFSDPSDEDLTKIREEMLDPIAQVFQEVVMDRRPNLKKEALSGRMFIASEAARLNMADSMGTFMDALEMAAGTHQANNSNSYTMFGTRKTDEQLTQQHEAELTALKEQHASEVEQLKEQVYALEGQLENLRAAYETEKADMLSEINTLTAQVQKLSEAPANEVADPEGDEGVASADAADQKTAGKLPWSGFASERL